MVHTSSEIALDHEEVPNLTLLSPLEQQPFLRPSSNKDHMKDCPCSQEPNGIS